MNVYHGMGSFEGELMGTMYGYFLGGIYIVATKYWLLLPDLQRRTLSPLLVGLLYFFLVNCHINTQSVCAAVRDVQLNNDVAQHFLYD